ncbi:MAG: translation elongation factor Ts [Armatimonadetes bacterium]|nr:translation elongation factor Ts [Armatimonadota bacterium]
MAISATDVKALRDDTGAGMMECKRALEEANGDFEGAKDILRRRGQAKSLKREGRATGEGCLAVAMAPDASAAVALELNCETDFVARTEGFRALAGELAAAALAAGVTDADELQVGDQLNEAVSRLGEVLRVGQLTRWTAGEGGVLGSYLHTATWRVAVLVEIGVDGDAAGQAAALAEVGRELGMQVTAMQPQYVDRDEVPAEALEREKQYLLAAQDMANKPPQIQEKILAGRLEKGFYQQMCLVDQLYARDDEKTIGRYLAETGKRLGSQLTVRRFVRLEVGRG